MLASFVDKKLHRSIEKFFGNKYVRILTAYFCFLTALSVTLSTALLWLECIGYDTGIVINHKLYSQIFGNGYLSIIYLGQIVFMRGFCLWSKISWDILFIYYLIYAFYKNTSYTLSIEVLTILNVVLLLLVIFAISDLINKKFRALE